MSMREGGGRGAAACEAWVWLLHFFGAKAMGEEGREGGNVGWLPSAERCGRPKPRERNATPNRLQAIQGTI